MDRLRVFVSYAHTDNEVTRQIVDALSANGLEPMWDQNLRAGQGFNELIKLYIAHAHVFMPVITPSSSNRGWVHQEIGYAIGLNVPVLPACIGQLPGEMTGGLQGAMISPEADLRAQLPASLFANLVRDQRAPAQYVCAALPDDRAHLLAEYAQSVRRVGGFGHVRQTGGLSTFHIPTRPLDHPVWQERFGRAPRSEYHCRFLREERVAFQEHATEAGCSLIVNPDLEFKPLGPGVRSIRIWTLIEFLEAMPNDRIRMVFDRTLAYHSEHIVGDWFLARSVAADVKRGWRQTIATRHAPTVRQAASDFDERFNDLLRRPGNEICRSKQGLIDALRRLPSVAASNPLPLGAAGHLA